MKLLAIDPGNEQSAYVVLDDDKLVSFGKVGNDHIGKSVMSNAVKGGPLDCIVVEMVACYGMSVGKEVFETCVWIGRFIEKGLAFGAPVDRVTRQPIKLHHCKSPRAKDGNIRQAIIDRYGGKDAAIGKKKTPGPLYGVSADVWQALALGLYWIDTRGRSDPMRQRQTRKRSEKIMAKSKYNPANRPDVRTFCPATMCPLFASAGSPWTGHKNAACTHDECGWFHESRCTASQTALEQVAELTVGGRPLLIRADASERRAKSTSYECSRAAECQWQIEAGVNLCPPRTALMFGLDPRNCAY